MTDQFLAVNHFHLRLFGLRWGMVSAGARDSPGWLVESVGGGVVGYGLQGRLATVAGSSLGWPGAGSRDLEGFAIGNRTTVHYGI